MKGLQVGKAINSILTLNNIDKVFAIVADVGTTFPFVVYRRSSLNPASTKDRYNYSELARMEIIVAGSSYKESMTLTQKVVDVLEHTRGTYEDIHIGEITFIDASEDYIEDAFILTLTFNIEIL